jgi:hypothetical protein
MVPGEARFIQVLPTATMPCSASFPHAGSASAFFASAGSCDPISRRRPARDPGPGAGDEIRHALLRHGGTSDAAGMRSLALRPTLTFPARTCGVAGRPSNIT